MCEASVLWRVLWSLESHSIYASSCYHTPNCFGAWPFVGKGPFLKKERNIGILPKDKLENYGTTTTGVAPASSHLVCRRPSFSGVLARMAVRLVSSTVLDVFDYNS